MTSLRYQGPNSFSNEQKAIYDEIIATRPGTGIQGPFKVWLGNPDICSHSQRLGRTVRYNLNTLDKRDSELVILIVAQHHKCETEWIIHKKEALNAGLEDDIINNIESNKEKCSLYNDKDKILYQFAQAVLNDSSNIEQDIYDKCSKEFSEVGTMEIVSLIGYYTYVAYTLNTFQIKTNV